MQITICCARGNIFKNKIFSVFIVNNEIKKTPFSVVTSILFGM